MPKEGREALLKLAVKVLGPADEADRGHPVAVIVECCFCRRDQLGVVRKSKVVIRAKINHVAPVDRDMSALGRSDFTLGFPKPFRADIG